ncbi:MAG: hypothetical protein FVQ85_05450 [Planctomycetes bacterium]|nr:hypothetical protein [Planctomycetota bacterium]
MMKNESSYRPVSVDDLPEFLVRAQAAVDAGRVDEAIGFLSDEAIKTVSGMDQKNPSTALVIHVLAKLFRRTNQLDRAEHWCKRILKQWPYAFVYDELGTIYRDRGDLFKALEYRRKALETDPDDANFLWSFGCMMMAVGRVEEGAAFVRKASEKAPNNAKIRSSFLTSLYYLNNTDPQIIFEEHKQWGRIHAPTSRAKRIHKNIADPDRRLRVGYISSDFRLHSVAFFFEPLLNDHDHEVVEVYGYGNILRPDRITRRLERKFDHYRDICNADDNTVADMIEADQIDILVELAGHTNERLHVLTYKPAPVQVDYLGLNTTGIEAIDYRLTDNFVNPPESQKFYTEKLVYLPAGFLCYTPPDFALTETPLPAARNGYITFGSFNVNTKINPKLMALWSEVLKSNGNSRFLLDFRGGDDKGVANYYLRQFEQLEISPERVEIGGWKSPVEHFQRYGEVDIILDTYPFNGATNTCHALWMGVPVISLVGRYYVSRAGMSILTRAGLDFCVALSPTEYVARATALARDPEALGKIRASMRKRLVASSLCNAKSLARSAEEAYRKMWRQWCQDRSAEVSGEKLKISIK